MVMGAEQQERVHQSRLGKRSVVVPAGVQLDITGDRVVCKGPKGTLERDLPGHVKVEKDGSELRIVPTISGRVGAQYQGLVRALLLNMVEGCSQGFKVSLDLYGVGYRAELKGSELSLALGLSHVVQVPMPESIKATVETIDEAGTKRPRLHLESHNKELLGQFAARIRALRPPEPYKGKGVRYTGEKIREKAGKAGGKK
jgi:large subunit ribosomal protein L6